MGNGKWEVGIRKWEGGSLKKEDEKVRAKDKKGRKKKIGQTFAIFNLQFPDRSGFTIGFNRLVRVRRLHG